MAQSHFGSNSSIFIKMVYELMRLKLVMYDILGFECPFQIEAR